MSENNRFSYSSFSDPADGAPQAAKPQAPQAPNAPDAAALERARAQREAMLRRAREAQAAEAAAKAQTQGTPSNSVQETVDYADNARIVDEHRRETKAQHAAAREQAAAAAPAQKGSGKKGSRKPAGKKKNKKLGIALIAVAAVLVLVGGGLFGLIYTGVIDLHPQKSYTYQVADDEALAKYLKHPSLKPGDTLEVSGSLNVDVEQVFGDVATLPLVNFAGSGSVNFQGGTVVFTGGQKTASFGNVSFTDSKVYIDAGSTALTWSSPADEDNLNLGSLNGTAHTRELSLLCVGAKTKVTLTLDNKSGGTLSGVQLHLTSASCIFPEGETYTVDSLPAGSSTVEVPVVITEAGRIHVSAYATDGSGATTVTGDSGYLSVAGNGYYAGDIHTHTTDSVYKREASLDDNVRYGYEHGMSFICSVENRNSPEEEYMDLLAEWAQEEAVRKAADKAAAAAKAKEEATTDENTDSGNTGTTPATNNSARTTAGGYDFSNLAVWRGSFSQTLASPLSTNTTGDTTTGDTGTGDTATTGNATGDSTGAASNAKSVLDEYPGTDYIAKQLDQSAVDAITKSTGDFIQIAAIETGYKNNHMLIYGANIAPPSNYGYVTYGSPVWTYQSAMDAVLEAKGIVVLPHFFKNDSASSISLLFSADGMTALEVISRDQKVGEGLGQVEYNAWNCVNGKGVQKLFAVMDSNNYTSDEVGLSFIEGHMTSLRSDSVYSLLRSGEFYASNGPEVRFTLGGHVMGSDIVLAKPADGAEATGTKATANFYVSDDSPITQVNLLRYTITGNVDTVTPEVVFTKTFEGEGDVYSYTGNVDVTLNPGEFWRVEVFTQSNNAGTDKGLGLSNPIYVSKDEYLKNSSMITSISCSGGAELKTAPNGDYYIAADRFNPSMLHVETDGKDTSVVYHRYNSSTMADKVTILITASDATQTTKTLYVVKK